MQAPCNFLAKNHTESQRYTKTLHSHGSISIGSSIPDSGRATRPQTTSILESLVAENNLVTPNSYTVISTAQRFYYKFLKMCFKNTPGTTRFRRERGLFQSSQPNTHQPWLWPPPRIGSCHWGGTKVGTIKKPCQNSGSWTFGGASVGEKNRCLHMLYCIYPSPTAFFLSSSHSLLSLPQEDFMQPATWGGLIGRTIKDTCPYI